MAGSEKVDDLGRKVQELMLAPDSGSTSYLLIVTGKTDENGEAAIHFSFGVPDDQPPEFYRELAASYLRHTKEQLGIVKEKNFGQSKPHHYDA